MRQTYKTRLGEFSVRADCVHGITVYKATREFTLHAVRVPAGGYFAIGHRDAKMMDREPLATLYTGVVAGRFRPDGTEVPLKITVANHPVRHIPTPPQDVTENDTMSW